MAPRYTIDLLKANEPKRDNMWSNKAGLMLNTNCSKLKVPLVKHNTFAARSFSYAAATL